MISYQVWELPELSERPLVDTLQAPGNEMHFNKKKWKIKIVSAL